MNKPTVGVLLLAVCCYVSSCSLLRSLRGNKTIADSARVDRIVDTAGAAAPAPVKAPISAPATADTISALKKLIGEVTPVWQKRLVYNTFSGKAKMHFSGPDQKLEFTAHVRMRKDSVIWINVSALGGVVQAAKIFVTTDSFFMINYQEQEVTRVALRDVAKVLPTRVDFAALQNFIAGDPLKGGEIKNVRDGGGSWTITLEDTAFIQQYTYNKTDSTLESALLNTFAGSGVEATTQYSSYLTVDKRKVSSLRAVNIQKGRDSTYSLDMNFTKIDLDQQLDYPFNIPANYTVK